jgi:hypothetical protein
MSFIFNSSSVKSVKLRVLVSLELLISALWLASSQCVLIGWMDRWMDGRTDGRMDDGWMDGWEDRWKDG